ncbi:hypothetical protein [Virgibacillus salexigens]|uniref:Uncharacterized protein n=2 Tax=Virgibacillus TaxID=84406 RepID=A0A024QBJ2_9BACI|nr:MULTISPECIES: hypothetical protein [Virgibacillus]GGJ48454.1 hypothetical protein GCM10007111_08200 [Virgibacillus kapii]CDQ39555.1 hypothetical protein BN990_01860 [Virgibacillus massiliensis]
MNKEEKRDLQHKPKEVKIILDKERTFVLDLNAYAEIDMLHEGKTYYDIELDVIGGRPYAIRAFMWGGLVHEDPDLTPEFVGKYITVDNFKDYANQLFEAMADSKSKNKENKQDDSDSKKK